VLSWSMSEVVIFEPAEYIDRLGPTKDASICTDGSV